MHCTLPKRVMPQWVRKLRFFFHLHTTWWPKTCWFFCLHQITICLLTPRKVVKKWKNTHLFKALHTSKDTIINKVRINKCKGWILNLLERQKLKSHNKQFFQSIAASSLFSNEIRKRNSAKYTSNYVQIKFVFSKKPTKIDEIFNVDLTLPT